MKNTFKSIVTVIALASMVSAFAQKPKAADKTITCPDCKMPMGTKKTDATPVAIKTKKGTYYCCPGCKMGKAAAKATPKKKA